MIVYTKGRTPDSQQDYVAPGKHDKIDVPLVVLVNRGSASASEIVAGAIQDHDRGLVVGETSWGKGLVQSVYSLQYGAGLALTTSKYYTPSGRNIQRDYSSFYDYYVADENDEAVEVPLKDRKKFQTDTGRLVYGGGGITPDVFVKPAPLSRITQLLEVRSAIFNFGVEYAANHPDLTKELAVTPNLIEEFVRYAADKEIAPVADIREALQKPNDRRYIERFSNHWDEIRFDPAAGGRCEWRASPTAPRRWPRPASRAGLRPSACPAAAGRSARASAGTRACAAWPRARRGSGAAGGSWRRSSCRRPARSTR